MGLGSAGWVMIIILFGITALIALIVFSLIREGMIDAEPPRQGELARFIRYMGCAAAMCSGGCESDLVRTHALEYEGNKVVKSCNQLIEENGWCDDKDPEFQLCGRDYAFEYTFKETGTYRDNYYVVTEDVRTWGTCGIGKSGWQTDASCIGNWAKGDIFEPSCERCKLSDAYYGATAPYGLLFQYGDGSTCDTRGGEMMGLDYDNFAGAIWVSEDFANGNAHGSCSFDGSVVETLGSCTFNEGNTFWIWVVENTQNVWIWEIEVPFFGKQRWQITCGGPEVFQCPKIVVCDHEP